MHVIATSVRDNLRHRTTEKIAEPWESASLMGSSADTDRKETVGVIGTVAPWMSGGASVHAAELIHALSSRYTFNLVTPRQRASATFPPSDRVHVVPMIPYFTTVNTIGASIRFLRGVALLHSHDARLSVANRLHSTPLA